MIYDKLNREDALQIFEMGKIFHQESQFKDEPYDENRVKFLLENTVRRPDRFYIAYNKTDKGKITGFVIMGINEHFFSGTLLAADYCLYIDPEHRGGSQVIRLTDKAYEWSKANGAKEMTIYHNTGIKTDTAPRLFNKLGFDTKGYIFTKVIE